MSGKHKKRGGGGKNFNMPALPDSDDPQLLVGDGEWMGDHIFDFSFM